MKKRKNLRRNSRRFLLYNVKHFSSHYLNKLDPIPLMIPSPVSIDFNEVKKLMNIEPKDKRGELISLVSSDRYLNGKLATAIVGALKDAPQESIEDFYYFNKILQVKLCELSHSYFLIDWLSAIQKVAGPHKLSVFLGGLLGGSFREIPSEKVILGDDHSRKILERAIKRDGWENGWETEKNTFNSKVDYLKRKGFTSISFPFSLEERKSRLELLSYIVGVRKIFVAILFSSFFPKSNIPLAELVKRQMSSYGGDLKKILLSYFDSYTNQDGVFTRDCLFQNTVIFKGSTLILNDQDWSEQQVKISWVDPSGKIFSKESRYCFNLNGFDDLFLSESKPKEECTRFLWLAYMFNGVVNPNINLFKEAKEYERSYHTWQKALETLVSRSHYTAVVDPVSETYCSQVIRPESKIEYGTDPLGLDYWTIKNENIKYKTFYFNDFKDIVFPKLISGGLHSIPETKKQKIEPLSVEESFGKPSSFDIFTTCMKNGAELALIQETNKVLVEGVKEILKSLGLDLKHPWSDTLLQILAPTLIAAFSTNERWNQLSTKAYSAATKDSFHDLMSFLKPQLDNLNIPELDHDPISVEQKVEEYV